MAAKRKPSASYTDSELVQPNEKLALIVGSQPLTRTDLITKVWEYIQKHGLQEKQNRIPVSWKTMINADEALQAVFRGKKNVRPFELTELIAAALEFPDLEDETTETLPALTDEQKREPIAVAVAFQDRQKKKAAMAAKEQNPASPERERKRKVAGFSDYSIYTIKHPKDLEAKARRGGPATFSEKPRWVAGYQLWQAARKAQTAMPVLLADATYCSRLLYWGVLTAVELSDAGTTFTVDRLRRFSGHRAPQELVLRNTGKHIAPNYIRPYAICRTPSFVTSDGALAPSRSRKNN